jgi:molybdenum cofactor biosynthesis protein B
MTPDPEELELFKLVVVTVSDRASSGVYEDESGPQAEALTCEYLADRGYDVQCIRYQVPDDRLRITRTLSEAVAAGADLLLTTGGTGLGPRDVTPEATRAIIDKEIPGLMEAVRGRYWEETPTVLLSRAIAGLAGQTVLVNLPGSVEAVSESLEVILPAIPHAVAMARGEDHPR